MMQHHTNVQAQKVAEAATLRRELRNTEGGVRELQEALARAALRLASQRRQRAGAEVRLMAEQLRAQKAEGERDELGTQLEAEKHAHDGASARLKEATWKGEQLEASVAATQAELSEAQAAAEKMALRHDHRGAHDLQNFSPSTSRLAACERERCG